ncbi:MAG: InlB B-repeat-containing protein [Paludibacteraceae bacterium]|nr:InlB B-repeat-containing protein [Paludibacteraceae bacterium]
MKTNILSINTIMKNHMKYICAVLLTIGASAYAWGADATYYVWDHSKSAWAEYAVQDENISVIQGPEVSGYTFFGWHIWEPSTYPYWQNTSGNNALTTSGYIATGGDSKAFYYAAGGEYSKYYIRFFPNTAGNTDEKNTGKNESDNKLYAVYYTNAEYGSTWTKDPGWSAASTDKVTITFNKNGGSGTNYTQTILKNTPTNLHVCEYTPPTGKEFAGWATSSGGSVVYADMASITASSNTTLYAIWRNETVTVTYILTGLNHSGVNQDYMYVGTSSLTANFTLADGYTNPVTGTVKVGDFYTYTINVDGGYTYSSGELTISNIILESGDDIIITLTATEQTCTTLDKPTGLTSNTRYENSGNTYLRLDWTTTSSVKTNASYLKFSYGKIGESALFTKDNVSKTATYWGKLRSELTNGHYWWKIQALGDGDDYCDSEEAEGGFCIDEIETSTPSGISATVLSTTSARLTWDPSTDAEGYIVTIKNHSTGTTVSGYDEEMVDATTIDVSGLAANTRYDVELTAYNACADFSITNNTYYFSIITYTVAFDLNGKGSGKPSDQTVLDGGKATEPSAPTAPSGYTFGGWYKESGCTNVWNFSSDIVSANQTLWAKWIEKVNSQLTVTATDGTAIKATPAGGSDITEGNTTNVEAGKTITLNYTTPEIGYTWYGWDVYKTGETSTKVSLSSTTANNATFIMPDYPVTVTAKLYGGLLAWCDNPEIALTGSPIVTAASHTGAVRATGTLTLTGTGLTPTTGTVTITTDNADVTLSPSNEWSFAAGIAAAKTPKQTITVTADASGEVNQTIYVHYKPSSNVDAVTDVTVTATYSGADDATTTIKVRSVKENFVIAAKVGTSWYALPNGMETSAVHEGVLIDVDETNKIAYGPSSVAYKMWPVRTTNGSANRYQAAGELVRFAGTEKALWANNVASGTTTGIRNWSTITDIANGASGSAGDTNDDAYEWKLTTTDGVTYTIQTNQTNNKRELVIYRPTSGENAGKLVWATNGTYETHELRLFPLEERASINIIPREWKTTGLVYSVPADNKITAVSYKIGTGSETATTYTRHSTGGYGLYEVVLPDLTSQYGQLLTLKMTIDGVATYAATRIPIIVNTNKSTKTDEPFASLDLESKNYDVVVLRGATLTTNASNTEAFKFHNLYLYAGATLVNNQNDYLSLSYLELRGGIIGIDAKNSYTQDVPHLMLGKAIAACPNGANLDMIVNIAHSYALSVPFDVSLTDVNFANYRSPSAERDLTGTLDSHFLIMEYDGDQRSTGASGWKHITSTSRVLHAGEGYVLQAKKPKGQPFGVIRFPLSKTTPVTAWASQSGEIEKGAISIQAHAGDANTPDNDKGWNLIANPYMANLSYSGSDESYAAQFTVGNLVKNPDDEHWDGTYKWTNTSNAYVTIPNDWYSEFPQYRANSAQAKYESFKNFFIQAGSDGSVTFDRSKRAAMPRYLMAKNNTDEPVYADINLTHNDKNTQAGITIDANATPGYKFGEDQNIFENREALNYLKMYTIVDGHYLVGNTITPDETAELIPLELYAPAIEGEYVFSLDENSDIDKLDYVMLYDAELNTTTNLLQKDYTVVLTKKGLIENRFSIGLKLAEKPGTATDIRDAETDSEQPLKFIWNDKMYILRNGVIYDATGKQVREIK